MYKRQEEEDVAKALSQDHTIIFKGMQKEYPNTIYLYIEERKTVAAMQWLGILYTCLLYTSPPSH